MRGAGSITFVAGGLLILAAWAVGAIGLFYLLTLYMGLGAMTGGVIDITNNNMSAPLLAKAFGLGIFAVISAIAFSTDLPSNKT